ncbi:peptidylprolyl isomerase [Candidatus Ulvibacter alkanivorans]|uniref:peptidylprolyl isomerase n=1 Tax=Candidatus Ulvibacter alkanivorans TaxID=2267620 RepID=UPI000DF125AC|nr:peptidylprolyl isomerase [Candidatus Ulvibacter alkanivorans]
MKKLVFAILLLSLAVVSCQSKYPDLDKGVYAEFITNKGTFVAKLYHEATPVTTANFVSLAEGENKMVDSTFRGKKYFNGLTFHRVIKDFMIQGGDPTGTGSGNPGYTFPDEIVDTLKHDSKGILSMANSGPDTNGSQFFITLKETPWLDGKHTVFGEIVKGQEIVDAIGEVETTKPGDKPVNEVVINEVNIIRNGNVKIASFSSEMEKLEKEEIKRKEELMRTASATVKSLEELRENAEELPSGLKINIIEEGTGEKPAEGSKVLMNYAGYLSDGMLFDSNRLDVAEKYNMVNKARLAAGQYVPVPTDYSPDAKLIAGFREGLLQMSVGDKAVLFIPAHLAYGPSGYPPVIPPNSDLIFELELVAIQ